MRLLTYCIFGGGFLEFRKDGTAECIDAHPKPIQWTGSVSTGQVGNDVEPQAGDKLDLTTISSTAAADMDRALLDRGLVRKGAMIQEASKGRLP